MSARFALYLAPEADDPLWHFGSEWLGYDAQSGLDVPHPRIEGVTSHEWREATAHPRLYGFHLTLKAPFRLAPGARPEELEHHLAELAARHCVVEPVPLELDASPAGDGQVFLCLRPKNPSAFLSTLEADAVVNLDPLRAPLEPAEYARRKPERLSSRELSYLRCYGYPHVLEAFRPHFSLTGPIAADSPLLTALRAHLDKTVVPNAFACRSLALFEQPEPGARFIVRRRFDLPGAA
jgi:hypothetical protein